VGDPYACKALLGEIADGLFQTLRGSLDKMGSSQNGVYRAAEKLSRGVDHVLHTGVRTAEDDNKPHGGIDRDKQFIAEEIGFKA
jgi:hypothetical protein